MDPLDPKGFLEFLESRPDFERQALALRADERGLIKLLEESFDLESLPVQMRKTVGERLRQVVLAHRKIEGGTSLYRKCTLELLKAAQVPGWEGNVLKSVDLGSDFERHVMELRTDRETLRTYCAEAFQLILVSLPEEIREKALKGVLHAAELHDPDEPELCTLGMKCFLALVAEIPPEMSELEKDLSRTLTDVTVPLRPLWDENIA